MVQLLVGALRHLLEVYSRVESEKLSYYNEARIWPYACFDLFTWLLKLSHTLKLLSIEDDVNLKLT